MNFLKLVLLGVLGLNISCLAKVGTSGLFKVPKDSAATCTNYCKEIGLDLGAVVVMADNVGCVCQPRSTSPQTQSSAAITGGMAAILIQEAQRQQRAQQTP